MKMRKKSTESGFKVPEEWTFETPAIAAAFDSHVRRELPWYDLATGAVAHVARCYIPEEGQVLDVGCSNGNVGRALAKTLEARRASLKAIDTSQAMIDAYDGPGMAYLCDVRAYDFCFPRPDLIVCFLSLMFVAVKHREDLLLRMKRDLLPGSAIVVVDKIVPKGGYVGTVNYRLALAAKYEAGATADEIIKKELAIAGLQRPVSESELDGFVEFFRFGDFAGYVWEKTI
jgi:tRNA (cmo5U34)-methyltransferase